MYTQETFIAKARVIHGNAFDYSQTVFTKVRNRIILRCNQCCTVFEQEASGHLQGRGCRYCANNVRLTTPQFVERATRKHGSKYDYTEVNYIDTYAKVRITCRDCGLTFDQSPTNHLKGHGCMQCGGTMKLTQQDFLDKAKQKHNDIYDYSQVVYVDYTTPVWLGCRRCRKWFTQQPLVHLRGSGCGPCSGNVKLSTSEFVEKCVRSYGDMYDYSRTEYIDARTEVTIGCKECNAWFTRTGDEHGNLHRGCPTCLNKTEKKLYLWLRENYPNLEMVPQFSYPEAIRRHYDAYFPGIRLLLELDGKQHWAKVLSWQSPEITREHDVDKMARALQHGDSMVRFLQEDVWGDKNDWREKLKSVIDYHLYLAINQKHTAPVVHFFDNKNEYQAHKEALAIRLQAPIPLQTPIRLRILTQPQTPPQ